MKTILLVVVASFCMIGMSNPLDDFIDNAQRIATEKEALVEWVADNSHNKVSIDKATRIVDAAYAHAADQKVDPLVILAMIKNESGFRAKVCSREGACSMMQIIPKYHRAKIAGRDINKLEVSIEVGSKILREYLDLSGDNLYKAMNRYSGGGGKAYYGRVAKTHKTLSRHIVEYAFKSEKQIFARHDIDKPIINPPSQNYLMALNGQINNQ